MTFYCIGEKLSHSFSKEIHDKIGGYSYYIKEIEPEKLDSFMESKEFDGLNVTIPYKEKVIPHMFFTEENAKRVGAVNTVVRRDGRLYGYNTDVYGMTSLISRAGIEVKGRKVLILGTGGTSKTAREVCRLLGAKEVFTVSREPKGEYISYSEAAGIHSDAHIIINTTPCGMYPKTGAVPIDTDGFAKLEGVVDAVYNPLRTELVMNALLRGIKATGGLYMLVSQAVRASEFFTGKTYGPELENELYNEVVFEKRNIVLTGMPSSGKTTLGKKVAALLGREFVDTDDEIVRRTGRDIPSIFREDGEKAFRDLEEEVIRDVSRESGRIISTGGGAILRENNVYRLKQNGRIVFIDRPVEKLIPTSDRPLAGSAEAVRKRYGERIEIYRSTCDKSFVPVDSIEENAQTIIRKAKEQ